MNAHDINKKRPGLISKINRALMKAVNSRSSVVISSMQEPDYVAAITVDFSPLLATILNNTFPQYQFDVSSVFCHQKPKVNINYQPPNPNYPKNPELGDLLFVYFEEQNNGALLCNSLLLQAKIEHSYPTYVAPNDLHQLTLYTEWPIFSYFNGQLSGQNRDIQPKCLTDGAQYMLIDDNAYNMRIPGRFGKSFLHCAVPSKVLFRDKSLSGELTDFFKFKAGRMFDENPFTTNDDWTKMIWDLLCFGICKFKRKNTNFNNQPRGNYFTNHFITSPIYKMIQNYGKQIASNIQVNPQAVDDTSLSVVIIQGTVRR